MTGRRRTLLVAAVTLVAVVALGVASLSNDAVLDALWPYLPQSVQTRPSFYVRHTLGVLRQRSVFRDRADWPVIVDTTLERSASATSAAETWPALQHALGLLDGGQSVIVPPPGSAAAAAGNYGMQAIHPERVVAVVFPGSAAFQAGIRPGDVIEAVSGQPPAPHPNPRMRGHLIDIPTPTVSLSLRRPLSGETAEVTLGLGSFQPLPAETRRLDHDLGYVEIPGTAGPNDFANRVREAIYATDAPTVCGWMIDLRRNSGGSLPTLLQALRPILGEQPLGGYVADGQTTPWTYPPEDDLSPLRPLARYSPAVAVLTSRLTAGAGEAAVVAFRGRERTRTVGEATWGLGSGLTPVALPDGAVLHLLTSLEADSTGAVREGPIDPDEPVPIDWSRLGAPDDPVLVAAGTWLRAQSSCQ